MSDNWRNRKDDLKVIQTGKILFETFAREREDRNHLQAHFERKVANY